MNLLFLAGVLLAILIGPLSVESSYGQSSANNTNGNEPSIEYEPSGAVGAIPAASAAAQENNTHIFMQVLVRNSHGELIGYAEGFPKVSAMDVVLNWVEPKAVKSMVSIDGKEYEMLTLVHTIPYIESTFLSAYLVKATVNDVSVILLSLYIDSIPVEPGDTAYVYWTITRSTS